MDTKDLQKLVRNANQRISKLRKLTNLKKPFATKQLMDYVDDFAVTKSGNISYSKNYSVREQKILEKALQDFMKSDFSKIAKIKEYKKEIEEEFEKSLSYKQTETVYISNKHYTWIYDYIPKSEFWSYWVKLANDENWNRQKWIDKISERIEKIPDEELKQDLSALYIYIKD